MSNGSVELAIEPPVNKNYQIRRILLEREIDEFEKFQSNATIFYEHYPNHGLWFEHAVEELRAGDRVAFGIYTPVIKTDGSIALKIIGSLMLKKKPFSEVVVLKNLFLEKECRKKKFGIALYNAAELYCAKGGFSKIVTEVPSCEFETINFLLTHGYQVEKTIESPYKKGDLLCEMYKKISPLYHGDFFDFKGLSKWILEHIYGFENITETEPNFFSFDIKIKHPSDGIKNPEIVPKGLAAIFNQLEILNDQSCEHFLEKSKGHQICVVFCNLIEPSTKLKLIDRGVLVLENEKIKLSLKDCFAYKIPNFYKKDVAGIIVTIAPEYFASALEQPSCFTYLKGGNVGQSLQKNDFVFFYTDISGTEKEEGIKGYGKVKNLFWGPKDEVWETFKEKNPLFTQNDYRKFAEKKNTILGIEIENFHQIEPIATNLLKEIIGSDIVYEDFSQYYIDHRVSTKILEIKKDVDPYEDIELSPDAPRIFISSTYLDLKSERDELRKTIKKDLRYHVYAFEKSGSGFPARGTILAKLEKSNIVIIIIGEKYGDVMNFEGKFISPTEDEFDHAKTLGKQILCYVKQVTKREDKLNDLLKKIGEYHKGSKYQIFSSNDELIKYVKNDIAEQFTK